MAIESIGGFSSISISDTSMVQNDRKTDVQKAATEINDNNPSVNYQYGSAVTYEGKEREDAEAGAAKENSENHLKSVLSVANQKIRPTNTRCEFQYHEGTKRVSIKVIDKSNDEVIREIPPEETLEMVEKIWELAGLFIDEKR